MQIIVIGDIHMAVDQLAALPLAGADLVVVNGDITNFGGRKEAKEVIDAIRQKAPNIRAQIGNLDKEDAGRWLEDEGINIHGRAIWQQAGFWLVGIGGSNPTPFHTPTEFSEKELARLAEAAFTQRTDGRPTLFISHCPPVDTAVDKISSGLHAGSTAVRKAIEKFTPELCITGHIHEAKGQDRIGSTRIFNPGMLQHGGWVEIFFQPHTATFTTVLH